MQKTSLAVSVQDILSNGGCKISSLVHANGDEWHPVIASHGEQKCIKCRCKVIIFFSKTSCILKQKTSLLKR